MHGWMDAWRDGWMDAWMEMVTTNCSELMLRGEGRDSILPGNPALGPSLTNKERNETLLQPWSMTSLRMGSQRLCD